MATPTTETDPRVLHARRAWLARFVAGGVPASDFMEVTQGIERWEDWCSAWSARAAIHETVGRQALDDGFTLSAGQHLTTAAACYHFAKFLFCEYPDEMKTAHKKAVECRTLALHHLAPPGERLEIPFEGKHLFANLRRPSGADRPPVVLLIPGMDSTKEEFHYAEQFYLERGMATLSLDGPGQGESEYDFPVRHDYEVPCGAVIDWLQARGDLNGARIGLHGISMGGYYVPRVAAFEKRVTAAIANSGAYSIQYNFDQRPDTLKEAYRMRTHSATVAEAREKTAAFDLEGVAAKITCPMFVIAALEDRITSPKDAERLASEVSGPVTLLRLEGANHVAQNRAHMWKTQAADWMAGHLGA
ncbi:MAG: alpha/beta hydrolase [Rhodospirillales bacterium]|nr:alpha/beta hydrolase [Rhodospirillales bacterium]